MSMNGSSQYEGRAANEGMSKRDQMKLQQAIKIIQSQENQQAKPPKRPRQSHPHPNQPNQRKQIKIDSAHQSLSNDQMISSPLNSSEPASKTPPQETQPQKQLPNHLNPSYLLPDGQGSIFNYLLCYSSIQGEKRFAKEGQDWSIIDSLSLQKLSLFASQPTQRLSRKLDHKFKELKDKLHQPLGKAHREFNQKFIKKDFLAE